MATDGPTPSPCDGEIFKIGTPVALIEAPSNAAERWVQSIASAADARVDWHYSGGIAQVLHLGDDESRVRVEKAIDNLAHNLEGDIMRRLPVGAAGLHRAGVTPAPEGTSVSFYAGGDSSAYI